MEISPERCEQIIREFDAQGWHRTGTPVDRLSARWLLERFAELGVDAEEVRFPFERIDAGQCLVTADGTEIEGIHLPDSTSLPPGTTIQGRVGGPASDAPICLLQVHEHGNPEALASVRREPHEAIIVAVEGDPNGFTLLNAWQYDAPFGPPVIQIPGSRWPDISSARSIRVTGGTTRTKTVASNVYARVPGGVPGSAPLVVLTPRSGWWHCAGERGGGLAIWLELARTVRHNPLERDVIFLATTGHELGFLGARRYLEADPGLVDDALAWLHLGANLGAANARLIVRASSERLLEVARSKAPSAQTLGNVTFQVATRPVGEAGLVAERGGRWISWVGTGFHLFHSSSDRWSSANDFQAVAEIGQMARDLLRELDRKRTLDA